jgi:hypothetical protein
VLQQDSRTWWKEGQDDGDEDAWAAQLDWKIIDGDVGKQFVSSGLEFVPLPVSTCFVNGCFDLVMFCVVN